MKKTLLTTGILSLVLAVSGHAATIYVNATAAAGGDGSIGAPFRKIQEGLNLAVAGDVVSVSRGTYREKLVFPRSGTPGSSITLTGTGGVVIDGRNRPGRHVVLISNKSYLTIRGFRIRNTAAAKESSLIRVTGKGDGIRIVENELVDAEGSNVTAISALGTSPADAMRDLRIRDNRISNIDAGTRAAISISGNVVDFDVDDNYVKGVSGAGIGLFGGYDVTGNDDADRPRLGVVRNNIVLEANSKGTAEFVAGITVDGASSNQIQGNIVATCDLGIELTAEKSSGLTSGNVVRNNQLLRNDKAGLVLGADDGDDGKVSSNRITQNSIYANAHTEGDLGEVVIRFASRNVFRHNKVETAQRTNFLIFSEETNANIKNTSNNNIFYSPAGRNGALFLWQGLEYVGFPEYQDGSGEDQNSVFHNTSLRTLL